MVKRGKVSRLLLVMLQYLGFSVLSGWVFMLFFLWAAQVMVYKYEISTGITTSIELEYLIDFICIAAGILIALFVFAVLLQRKFAYILQISNIVERMEGGEPELKIPMIGNDEMTDLSASINRLTESMNVSRREADELKERQLQTVAELSHELRTPLTLVLSYLQFICDGQYKDEEQLQLYAAKANEKAIEIKEISDRLFEKCEESEKSGE